MLNRRRFINIMAVGCGLASAGKLNAATIRNNSTYWQGIALGADAQLQIVHTDKKHAAELVNMAIAEVKRLEKIFSLYQADSAICTLNKNGSLQNAPADLQRLLSESRYYSKLTNGMFDPSVQPIWNYYAENTKQASRPEIEPVLAKVGYKAIQIDKNSVSLARPGMAITLNGIAQGYITDRVAELLHANGLQNALIDMGEIRALGHNQNHAPWLAGIARPGSYTEIIEAISLNNMALATSGGYGTSLDENGETSHLFNPHTGIATPNWASVTVKAKTATMADALSTAFSMMTQAQIMAIVDKLPIEAWLVKNNSGAALHLS